MEKTSTKKKPTKTKETAKKETKKKPVAAKKSEEKKVVKKSTTKKTTAPKKKNTTKKVVKEEAPKTTKKTSTKKAAPKKATPKKNTTKKVAKEEAPKAKKKATTKKTTTKKTTSKKTTPKKRTTTKKKESLEKKAIDSVIKYFLSLFSVFLIFSFFTFEITNTIEPKQVQAKEKSEQKEEIKKTGINISQLQSDYKNADIIAFLEIPEVMTIPIVKTYDNNYYLTHRLDHSTNVKGTPFMDYRVKEGDKKILIYGHSAYDYDTEMPFRQLYKYDDLEFYKTHPKMYLYFKEKKYTYDIFSIYLEKKDFDYVNINSFNILKN